MATLLKFYRAAKHKFQKQNAHKNTSVFIEDNIIELFVFQCSFCCIFPRKTEKSDKDEERKTMGVDHGGGGGCDHIYIYICIYIAFSNSKPSTLDAIHPKPHSEGNTGYYNFLLAKAILPTCLLREMVCFHVLFFWFLPLLGAIGISVEGARIGHMSDILPITPCRHRVGLWIGYFKGPPAN